MSLLNAPYSLALMLTGTLLLSGCESTPTPTPPVVVIPIINTNENRPTLTLSTMTPTTTSVLVAFSVAAVKTTTLDRCEITVGSKKQTLTLTGVDTAVRSVLVEGLSADTAYPIKIECFAKDTALKEFNTVLSSDTRTLKAAPVPTTGEGGSKNGFLETFDPNKDSYWLDLEQVNPDGSKEILRYLRGTFPLSEVLPTSLEYFLSNTTTNTSNSIAGTVNTQLLNQGQLYSLIARVPSGQPNGGKVVGEYRFVPDNVGPQIADIQPNKGQSGNGYLSQLSVALTSSYGNWVGGGARVVGFDTAIAQFAIRLSNTRSLEDNPVPNPLGATNPGNNVAKFAVGVKFVRYYAVAVDNGFVGDLETALKGAAGKLLLLGQIANNNISGNPTLNNYPSTVQTLQGDSKVVAGLSQLGDGGGAKRYVLFSVSYDRLGNPSLDLNTVDSYYNAKGYPFVIINVDNTAPTVTAPTLVDRGPLDVHARGEGCDRVDITKTPNLAPTDIFTAETGWVSGCAIISAGVTDSGVGFDSDKVVNTSGHLVNLGAPSSGFLSNQGRLGLSIQSRSSASLPATVINLNDLSGPQTFSVSNVSDLLGNVAPEKKSSISVDNEEPTNLIVSVASQNSSNSFAPWQQVGLVSSGTDGLSGMRKAGDVAPYSLFYGTDFAPAVLPEPFNAQSFTSYNNALVQIAPNDLGSFNIPFPGIKQVEKVEVVGDHVAADVVGDLNLWVMGVDRAGNASAEKETLQVRRRLTVSKSLPIPLQPIIRADLGASELGTPSHPYQGFTALNYNKGGVVPINAKDLGTTGPTQLNADLEDYLSLPSPGDNGTSLYRLFIPNDDLLSLGDPSLGTGLGKVGFLYRFPDPVMSVSASSPFATVSQINPALYWPNSTEASQAATRTGSFRYNLPAWSTRLESDKQVGHLWNTISNAESRPYNADFLASFPPSLIADSCVDGLFQCSSALRKGSIATVVFNNYGFAAVQTKK